ncbi:5-formyltetrahydrofolate cyclo-ligase [Microbacterium sp. KSW4-16]|jgi:5-formyltetrahydrofolate cyclo-ligase|uniref:5-formyltetrahydrofolate cyclo-ligase n=1 Tax=Microbacterium aurugineum TaxID=2851642 RepID=A0ABY4IXS8_9MICO|nr:MULTISPECIES: 5-formyltetrahydrofolate cyclo-ligase [Microbacterium]PKQ33280.1 MAG: 5-formyltetrahydrofolate cyclo-ligase [Actinobacteria bacterium HGW-Actinobacteria-11]MCK8468243.1 5-formyltetrahydrofolate cyclo-ligase [Microbacterium aurugineum]MCZ4301505.1 5-formyltetrahydrofolate cyclo-ligase [Microbacterium oxydans]QEA30292.1 5-formyltetrahydrofolate cyclo-ligase [Microbacterium sp. CBA3102]TCJ28820.1 5-formyltetrahydrofolate cyclo-ligase [Microbacterium sp. PI-1]
MSNDVEHAKRALRADLRERRQLLSDAQREAAATAIGERLDALIDDLGARSISCFLSTTTEPGTREFVTRAVRRGIRVLLPVTRADGLLDWAVATEDDEIAEGLYGLPEPTGEVLGPIAVNDVELMIVPASAVDRSGMRMGWGRGYFDKTIGSMERCPPVYAVVYDSEVLDELPSEVHDQPVNGVVTPSQTLTLSPPRR